MGHHSGKKATGPAIWLLGTIFYVIFAIIWLQYLPKYSAFNKLAVAENILPFESFLLISFFWWIIVMAAGWIAWK